MGKRNKSSKKLKDMRKVNESLKDNNNLDEIILDVVLKNKVITKLESQKISETKENDNESGYSRSDSDNISLSSDDNNENERKPPSENVRKKICTTDQEEKWDSFNILYWKHIDLTRKYRELNAENEGNEKLLQYIINLNKEKVSKLNSMQEEIEKSKELIDVHVRNEDKLKKDINDLKKENVNLKMENEKLLLNKEDLEKLIDETSKNVELWKEKWRILEKANEIIKEENFSVLDKIETVKMKLKIVENTTEELRNSNLELKEVHEKYNELNAESKAMTEMLEEKVAELDLKSCKIVELENKINWLENELTGLENVSTENKDLLQDGKKMKLHNNEMRKLKIYFHKSKSKTQRYISHLKREHQEKMRELLGENVYYRAFGVSKETKHRIDYLENVIVLLKEENKDDTENLWKERRSNEKNLEKICNLENKVKRIIKDSEVKHMENIKLRDDNVSLMGHLRKFFNTEYEFKNELNNINKVYVIPSLVDRQFAMNNEENDNNNVDVCNFDLNWKKKKKRENNYCY